MPDLSKRPRRNTPEDSEGEDIATTVEVTGPEPIAAPPATPGGEGFDEFGVQVLRSNSSGALLGVAPNARFYVIACEGEGVKRTVRIPPTAKLSPPRVRRSLLILAEGDDPVTNPPRG